MKRLCVGALLVGLSCLLSAGCGEANSSTDQGGRFYSERDEGAATANASPTADGDNKPTAALADSGKKDASADDAATARQSDGRPQDGQPDQPPAGKAAGAAATAGSASDGAKTASRRHLAPQQVASGGDGRAKNITFDNIKFDMDDPKSRLFKRDMLTDAIEKLSGNRVRIRGFILPGVLEEFSNFVLVRDDKECCFGPGAAIYDSIMVAMADGKSTRFTTRPVTVEGTFEIEEVIGPDKRHWSIYRLTATKVE